MKPQMHYLSHIKAKEENVNGLIILSAHYGNLLERYIDEKKRDERVVIDVTTPLQILVKDSKLSLDAGSKMNLSGFYDPCPQEPKRLEIEYKYDGVIRKVMTNDTEPVHLPRTFHQITS